MKPPPKSGTVTIGTKPAEAMWGEMDKLYRANPEPVGPGWFTVEQFAQRYGLSRSGAAQRLHKDRRLLAWLGVGGPNKRLINKYRIRPTP